MLRIDPVTGEDTKIKIVTQGSSGPQSLLADDGGVFVAVSRDKALYRIDAATETVEKLQGEVFACGGMAKVGQIVWGTGCFSGPWVAGFDTQTLQPESLFVPSSLTIHATWENSLTYTFPTSHASTGFGLIHFWFTRIR